MANPNRGNRFLNDLREFLTFFKSMWVIAADFFLAFPLINSLVRIIPIASTQDDPAGSWTNMSVAAVTGFSMVFTIFVILWSFGQRDEFISNTARWAAIPRESWKYFYFGILSLILYFGIHETIYNLLPWKISYGEPITFVIDIVLLISYTASFALLTRAFMLLGMREFFKQ